MSTVSFFLFQAEDGIRDLVRSRGLGDVYKRQTLYDVRVLDERGVGTVADLLVGIDWVLQRSRLHNIRVMNLSLAANGIDSFVVDPLARAARSAVASGIVVVASASNAGKNEAGQEVYGLSLIHISEPTRPY